MSSVCRPFLKSRIRNRKVLVRVISYETTDARERYLFIQVHILESIGLRPSLRC